METPNLNRWLHNFPPEESGTPLLDYLEPLQCSDTANSLGGLVGSPMPSKNSTQTKSSPSNTATSMNRRSPVTPENSPKSESTEISATTILPLPKNSLISSPVPFHALGQVTPEVEQDLITKNPVYGARVSELCARLDQGILSGSNLWELPLEVYEQSLALQEWQAIRQQVLQLPLANLGQLTRGNESLSLPTLTTGKGTTRNAGRTKLETKLKTLGIVPDGYQLSPEAMAEYMGFEWDWFEPITGQRLTDISTLCPTDYDGVMMPGDLPEKLSPQRKRRSPSVGLSPKKKQGSPRGSTGKASGWLTPFTEKRNGKTYPIIQGERVPKDLAAEYPHHYFWFYQYKSWCDRRESWRTISKRVDRRILTSVRHWIRSGVTVSEILKRLGQKSNGS